MSPIRVLSRLLRISLIYACISKGGWDFYYKYVISFFKQGVDSVLFTIASSFEVSDTNIIENAVIKGDFTDKSILFYAGFQNLKIIFSEAIFNKILAFLIFLSLSEHKLSSSNILSALS